MLFLKTVCIITNYIYLDNIEYVDINVSKPVAFIANKLFEFIFDVNRTKIIKTFRLTLDTFLASRPTCIFDINEYLKLVELKINQSITEFLSSLLNKFSIMIINNDHFDRL